MRTLTTKYTVRGREVVVETEPMKSARKQHRAHTKACKEAVHRLYAESGPAWLTELDEGIRRRWIGQHRADMKRVRTQVAQAACGTFPNHLHGLPQGFTTLLPLRWLT